MAYVTQQEIQQLTEHWKGEMNRMQKIVDAIGPTLINVEDQVGKLGEFEKQTGEKIAEVERKVTEDGTNIRHVVDQVAAAMMRIDAMQNNIIADMSKELVAIKEKIAQLERSKGAACTCVCRRIEAEQSTDEDIAIGDVPWVSLTARPWPSRRLLEGRLPLN